MTRYERLIRDIDILRENVQLDWRDLAGFALQPAERATIRCHIDQCITDLTELRTQVDVISF